MNPCIGTGLFQVAEMAFTGYLVKDDSGNAHRRIEMFVSVKYRSYRITSYNVCYTKLLRLILYSLVSPYSWLGDNALRANKLLLIR